MPEDETILDVSLSYAEIVFLADAAIEWMDSEGLLENAGLRDGRVVYRMAEETIPEAVSAEAKLRALVEVQDTTYVVEGDGTEPP